MIRIKNVALAKRRYVELPRTNLVHEVAKVLVKEGYLAEVTNKKGILKARLVYQKKEPFLMNLRLISKPGLRIYKGVDELRKHRGASFFVISTPQGVMSSRQAVKKNIGGEAIAEIW